MDRRRFLGSLVAGGMTTAFMGCRTLLCPDTNAPRKVVFDNPPGGGGGEVTLVGLYLPAGSGIERLFLQPKPTVKEFLISAQLYGLAVEFEAVPGIGDFVRRLGAVAVTTHSVPNLYYAVGSSPFTSELAWEIGVGSTNRGVNLQACPPAGGAVDWRLAIL